MSGIEDEFSQTREALFEVRNMISALEKASALIVGKPESSNFKRNMLDELDDSIQRLSTVRSHIEKI